MSKSNPFLGVISAVVGIFTAPLTAKRKVSEAEEKAKMVLAEAEAKQKLILVEAKEETLKLKSQAEQELKERQKELQQVERRLSQKDETLDRKIDGYERKERSLQQKHQEVETLRSQIEETKKHQIQQLQEIAGLTHAEAREVLLRKVDMELEHEKAKRILDIEHQIRQDSDRRARKAIALAIQRLTSDVVSETAMTVVPIPSDDVKGRLIGREGRNIRALENATGVDLIIDDTPEVVTLSGFDPVRREIARVAIGKLILDGRIHPARIEDMVERARKEVEETIHQEGQMAIVDAGVPGLSPEIVELLGRLKYRYSYGQNVLKHSIECANLAGIMAAEIGANVRVAKAGALLHDIGKALTHEIEGGHAEIGGDIARKYGIHPEVAKAIEEHHNDGENVNVEAFLVAASDAISGGRPGARRDTAENYVKRLQALEEAANSFPGVEKSFAIQAGREVRIMVKPESLDDASAAKLAHDVAKKIHDNLVYPGQIKVTVIRETRIIDYAK